MESSSLLEKAQAHRLKQDLEALGKESRKIGEGANKSVYRSARDYTVSRVVPYENGVSPSEQSSMLNEVSGLPWFEVEEDCSINYPGTLVRMEEADLSHEQAVQLFGLEEAISKDVEMFKDLFDQGITYRDFKPDNIGYFEEKQSYEPLPIDLFGEGTWSQNESDITALQDAFELYIDGNTVYEGVADKYDVSSNIAEEYVIDALIDNLNEFIEDDYRDFRDAVRQAF